MALSGTLLEAIAKLPSYEFWPDDISYKDVSLTAVAGHQQVTDAYLVSLATSRKSRLATFDRALAITHPDSTLILLS